MTDQSGRRKRKRTGGRRVPSSDKQANQRGREPAETTVDEERIQTVDTRGNGQKVRALSTDTAQVAVDGDTETAEIENVVENPANVNYVRRNIVTKGAVIETSAGRARVTSRPGQSGQVNAVLTEE
ncbi:30S ribosomal protein S8e [Halobaculum sp. MBLA0143]|uniref:30S ribosomal protein S8e n=1 Tax=Halobaculum sp. MBLA0143 TaxID=3079933 RepID=UPI003525574E